VYARTCCCNLCKINASNQTYTHTHIYCYVTRLLICLPFSTIFYSILWATSLHCFNSLRSSFFSIVIFYMLSTQTTTHHPQFTHPLTHSLIPLCRVVCTNFFMFSCVLRAEEKQKQKPNNDDVDCKNV